MLRWVLQVCLLVLLSLWRLSECYCPLKRKVRPYHLLTVLCCGFVIPSHSGYNKRTDQLVASTEPSFDGCAIVTALR